MFPLRIANSLVLIYYISCDMFGIALATIEISDVVATNLKFSTDSHDFELTKPLNLAGGGVLKKELSRLLEVLGASSTGNLEGIYIQRPQNKIDEKQLLTAIKELHTEISALTKNLSKTDNCSVSCIQQPQNKIFEEQLLTATKELHSEISALKKDLLKTLNSPVGCIQQPENRIFEEKLLTTTKEIYSEISALKNLPATESECLIESSIREGKSYPVGVSYRQLCPTSALNREVKKLKKYIPKSCKEIQATGNNVSGIHEIQPTSTINSFQVLCDMDTQGGGWTVIQKRYDGSVDFYLGWLEYKFGFGDLAGEFWIGLENIYKMTGFTPNELLIEVVDRDNVYRYAHYTKFGVGSEPYGYPLKVIEGFSGNASDCMTYHRNMKFSTKDFDQDNSLKNCAETYRGAWWYNDCYCSNVNGYPINVDIVGNTHHKDHGIQWLNIKNHDYNFAKVRMMVRPVGG